MCEVHLNALQKFVAAQREEAGGAQKVCILSGHENLLTQRQQRTRATLRTEDPRKKYRGYYA